MTIDELFKLADENAKSHVDNGEILVHWDGTKLIEIDKDFYTTEHGKAELLRTFFPNHKKDN